MKNSFVQGAGIDSLSVVLSPTGVNHLLVRSDSGGAYLISLSEVRDALRLCSFNIVQPVEPGFPVLVTNLSKSI